jgi:hypothetical protein
VIDSVGNVSSALVIGSGNPLCLATLDHIVGPRLANAFLIDNDEARLLTAASHVSGLGVADIRTGTYRVDQMVEQRKLVGEAFALFDIDVAIIGPTSPSEPDIATSPTHEVRANLIDLMTFVATTLSHMERQGHGVVVLFSHSRSGPADDASLGQRASALAADVVAASMIANADPRIKIISSRIDPLATNQGRSGGMPDVNYQELASGVYSEVRNAKQKRMSVTIEFPRTARSVMNTLAQRRPRASKKP